MNLPIRPRRNRRSAAIRALVRETVLSPGDFVQPLFVQEGEQNDAISSMPGVTRWCEKDVVAEVLALHAVGVPAVVLFPKIDDSLKTSDAAECYNPDGLIPRLIRAIKAACPEICVITDIALDPYNADGHDGLVEKQADGSLVILNDETVDILCQQALCHAAAGADIVSPSDILDGRVPALRRARDVCVGDAQGRSPARWPR